MEYCISAEIALIRFMPYSVNVVQFSFHEYLICIYIYVSTTLIFQTLWDIGDIEHQIVSAMSGFICTEN